MFINLQVECYDSFLVVYLGFFFGVQWPMGDQQVFDLSQTFLQLSVGFLVVGKSICVIRCRAIHRHVFIKFRIDFPISQSRVFDVKKTCKGSVIKSFSFLNFFQSN